MSDCWDHMVDAYESADHGYDYNHEGSGGGYPPKPPTCSNCGKNGLSWGIYGQGYRLFEHGKLHVCDAKGFKEQMRKLFGRCN